MFDFTMLWVWSTIAALTFLLVYIGLYAARWKKPDNTADDTALETVQEAEPKRTPGHWARIVLLSVLGLYAWLLLCLVSFFFFIFLIIAAPLAALILFVICLIRYIRIRRKQKRCPEEVDPAEVKFHRTCAIVFAALFAVILGVVLCLLFIPSGDVAFM